MLIKKIALVLLCVLPFSLKAQEVKLGHVNFQEIVTLMPELTTIQKKLDDQSKEVENELGKMNEEFNGKLKDFQDKQGTMPESIKQTRQTELQDLQQRIQTFRQTASTDLQKMQQELLAPVYQKINKTISEIAVEGKYLYIFKSDPQILIYQAPNSNDITKLVEKKLGLDKKPAPAVETKK